MFIKNIHRGWWLGLCIAVFCLLGTVCRVSPLAPPPRVVPAEVPRELQKQTLPAYKIQPPDVLQIEAVWLPIKEGETTPDKTQPPRALYPQPVTGPFLVKPDGTVELGV